MTSPTLQESLAEIRARLGKVMPECPPYVAHPQAVWFEDHWMPAIREDADTISRLLACLERACSQRDGLIPDLLCQLNGEKYGPRVAKLKYDQELAEILRGGE